MDDLPKLILVTRQPGDRSDRAGDEKKAIAVARLKRLNLARQHRRDCDSREVVVSERRVANVAGK